VDGLCGAVSHAPAEFFTRLDDGDLERHFGPLEQFERRHRTGKAAADNNDGLMGYTIDTQ
jgi:hypothetical protein